MAPVLAAQLALKEVWVIDVGAEATGSGGTVTTEMVLELNEVPDVLDARTR